MQTSAITPSRGKQDALSTPSIGTMGATAAVWPRCDHGHSAVPLATPAVPSAPGLIPAPRHRQVHVRLEPMNVTLFADVIKVRLGHTRGGWDPIQQLVSF